MSISFFEKVRIFVVAYYFEKAGVALREWLEGKIKILLLHAPQGKSPYVLSITADDKTEVTEIEDENTEAEITDKEALIKNMGVTYFNALQHKAVSILEKISSLERGIAEITQLIKENRQKQAELLENNPDYYSLRKQFRINLLIFLTVAASEVAALFVVFGDLFGIDPQRLGSEIHKPSFLFLVTAVLTVGFFIALLRTAEQVYTPERAKKLFWITVLLFIATVIGILRGMQSAALGEVDISVVLLSLLFTILTFAFPLVAAAFYIKMKEASDVISLIESKLRSLKEQEGIYLKQLEEAKRELKTAQGQFDAIVQEFVSHYQRPRLERERRRAEWELYTRYMEAYLNIVRLCYLFWQGLHSRGLVAFGQIKRLAQIMALIILALIILLIFGRSNAHAEDAFNVMVVGDRSSSAGEYSCTPEALEKIGQYWVKRADDRGGGAFEVVIADRGFDSTEIFFSEEYPQSFAGPVSVHKKQYRERFLQRLKEAAERLPSNRGSAIIEAIYRASLRLREGETWIYVLSDLREKNGSLDFERSPPSESEFLNWVKANGIKPVFNGTTRLLACGIHPYSPGNTSPMTIQNYNRLVRLWGAIFHYWGVEAKISEACDLKD